MAAPNKQRPVRHEVDQSTDGRTGKYLKRAEEQLALPFAISGLEVGRTSTLSDTPIEELQSPEVAGTLLDATAMRRKRGPSLSRRIGQKGNVFQRSEKWDPVGKTYGRFWVDVP